MFIINHSFPARRTEFYNVEKRVGPRIFVTERSSITPAGSLKNSLGTVSITNETVDREIETDKNTKASFLPGLVN